ncbi:hypothetical protein L1887_29150 [Cichorium endivia]|nr:hypothetical protein L1887_29150 [Cichorium endivia]
MGSHSILLLMHMSMCKLTCTHVLLMLSTDLPCYLFTIIIIIIIFFLGLSASNRGSCMVELVYVEGHLA